jgi:hypothetical protein
MDGTGSDNIRAASSEAAPFKIYMEFLLYIINPNKVVNQFKEKYKYKIYFLDLLITAVTIGLVTFLSVFIASYFQLELRSIRFPQKNISYFLMGVFLAPILEEFIFRAPLKRTKVSFWCFGFGFIYFSTRFLYGNQSIYGFLGVGTLSLVLVLLYRYKIHFMLNGLVYLSALLFGLVHLQNLDFDYTSAFGAIVYSCPIFFGGLVLSYIRLKYSLLAAILFHSSHNLVVYALFLFG